MLQIFRYNHGCLSFDGCGQNVSVAGIGQFFGDRKQVIEIRDHCIFKSELHTGARPASLLIGVRRTFAIDHFLYSGLRLVGLATIIADQDRRLYVPSSHRLRLKKFSNQACSALGTVIRHGFKLYRRTECIDHRLRNYFCVRNGKFHPTPGAVAIQTMGDVEILFEVVA